jgi:hypothetical protein
VEPSELMQDARRAAIEVGTYRGIVYKRRAARRCALLLIEGLNALQSKTPRDRQLVQRGADRCGRRPFVGSGV